jgi:hypothetical protein
MAVVVVVVIVIVIAFSTLRIFDYDSDYDNDNEGIRSRNSCSNVVVDTQLVNASGHCLCVARIPEGTPTDAGIEASYRAAGPKSRQPAPEVISLLSFNHATWVGIPAAAGYPGRRFRPAAPMPQPKS